MNVLKTAIKYKYFNDLTKPEETSLKKPTFLVLAPLPSQDETQGLDNASA